MNADAARGFVPVALAGEVSQGTAIDVSVAGEIVQLPRAMVEDHDIAFRAATSQLRPFSIERGDILVVEPRPDGQAATAELVLVMLGDRAFVGRWWTKHRQRAVFDHAWSLISDDRELRVVGTITVIVRLGDAPPER